MTSIRGLYQKKLVLVLPILDALRTCCVKIAVVCVTELIAVLIQIDGLLSLLADVYGFLILPLLPASSDEGHK